MHRNLRQVAQANESLSSAAVALNGAQKNIIEGTLKNLLSDIMDGLNINLIKAAFDAIQNGTLSESDKLIFEEKDILDLIIQIRTILVHPYPQNRRVGDPYAACIFLMQNMDYDDSHWIGVRDGVVNNNVYFFDTSGVIVWESQGFLGLTSRNDSTALPVTREAVVEYMNEVLRLEKIKFLNESNYSNNVSESDSDTIKRSHINPSYGYSKSRLVVNVIKVKEKTNIYGICLEGIKENGREFKEYYHAKSFLNTSHVTIKISDFNTDFKPKSIDTYNISSSLGSLLINSMRSDISFNFSIVQSAGNTSNRLFKDFDSVSKKWVDDKLRKIGIIADYGLDDIDAGRCTIRSCRSGLQ